MDAGETLERLIGEEPDFEVVIHEPSRHDASRPLVVLIHPGDMTETPEGFSRRDWEKVRDFSESNQDGLVDEIDAWLDKGADFVVLHRQSCAYDNDGLHEFHDTVRGLWENGAILYGDDLDAAGAWIIEKLAVAERPMVFMGGAYSTPEGGCLTRIGTMIEAVVGEDRMTVSDWSPASNSDKSKVWRPRKPESPLLGGPRGQVAQPAQGQGKAPMTHAPGPTLTYDDRERAWLLKGFDVNAVLSGDPSVSLGFHEISSMEPGKGNAERLLRWLRERCPSIGAHDPGEPGTGSRAFWDKMAEKGLLDWTEDD